MSLKPPLPRPEGPGFTPRLRTVRHDDGLLWSFLLHMSALSRHSAYELQLIRGQQRVLKEALR